MERNKIENRIIIEAIRLEVFYLKRPTSWLVQCGSPGLEPELETTVSGGGLNRSCRQPRACLWGLVQVHSARLWGIFLKYFSQYVWNLGNEDFNLGIRWGRKKNTILYGLQVGEVVTNIPTIGFNVETETYKNHTKFQVWELEGQGYTGDIIIQTQVYVVDNYDWERIGISKLEFVAMLKEKPF